MGLLDAFKDKAAELLEGAKEQVGDATGLDLSGDTAETATQAGQDLTEAGTEAGEDLTEAGTQAGEDLTGSAEGAVNDAAEKYLGG